MDRHPPDPAEALPSQTVEAPQPYRRAELARRVRQALDAGPSEG